jgi:hypothetical protein
VLTSAFTDPVLVFYTRVGQNGAYIRYFKQQGSITYTVMYGVYCTSMVLASLTYTAREQLYLFGGKWSSR